MKHSLVTAIIIISALAGSAYAPVAYAGTNPPSQVSATSALGGNPAAEKTDFNLKTSDGMNTVMVWIATLFAWLVGAAAVTLDYAAYYTVVTMGTFVRNMSAIGLTWSILRDIGNIMFIFGFLVAGIMVILDTQFYGWSKKMIPMLLIGAVFINFSLFFTEAIIDVGNLFATEFYTQINGGLPNLSTVSASNEVISNAIMANLGIQTIYGNVLTHNQLLAKNHPFLVGFMSILLFIILAFVMFSLAAILIFRFVMLIYYIIMSPVGFAGFAIPRLGGLSKRWLSGLFEQTITAPILFLLLYIALKVITAPQFLGGFGLTKGTAAGAATGFVSKNLIGFGGFLLSFIVAMGLLIFVAVAAKRLGAAGTSVATRIGGRMSFGAVSLGARATLGGLGVFLGSQRMQAAATQREGDSKKMRLARLALRAGTFTGKTLREQKFDMRNTAAGSALRGFGIDAGKGATMSARTAIVEKQLGFKPVKQWWDKSQKEYHEAAESVDLKKASTAMHEAREDLSRGNITQAEHDERIAPHKKRAEEVISKASPQRLVSLASEKGNEVVASYLSPRQFEKLMTSDSKEVSEHRKEVLSEQRFHELNQALKNASAQGATEKQQQAARDAIAKLDSAELPFVQSASLKEPFLVRNLSPKQFQTVMEKVDNPSLLQEVQQERFAPLRGKIVTASETTGTAQQRADATKLLEQLDANELQYLDKETLLNPFVARHITEDQFTDLQKKNILNALDKAKLQAERKKRFDVAATSPAEIADEVRSIGKNYDKLKKQVPAEALTHPEVLDKLGPEVINIIDMAGRGGLSATDRRKLGEYINKQIIAPEQVGPLTEQQALLAAYAAANPDIMREQFGVSAAPALSKPAEPSIREKLANKRREQGR